MPGTWPDDDAIGDDDADDAGYVAPVHPDDRLWRHPSEMAWGIPPSAAMTPAFGTPTVNGGGDKPVARTWVIAVTSGLTGAALALGMVVLFAGIGTGPTDRVIERIGVRDRLADPMTVSETDDVTAGVVAIAREVLPSVVRLEVGTSEGTNVGSGVVILDDGHILTNAHVVDDARSITIIQADGTAVNGQVVGADTLTDIAVVAPDDPRLTVDWTPAVRGPAGDLVVGEPVLAVGSPLGLAGAPSVTLGVVSSLSRRVSLVSGGTLHGMVHTDAPITGSSSGGALCDRMGRVVGLLTSAFVDESPASGFATPMETAWRVAESLMDDGVVHHVWLGIEGVDLDATRSSILGLQAPIGGGVVVDRVIADSPAEDADLESGDVLVSLDGEPLSTMSDLVLSLRDYEPGDRVTIGVERDGEVDEALVTLTERSAG